VAVGVEPEAAWNGDGAEVNSDRLILSSTCQAAAQQAAFRWLREAAFVSVEHRVKGTTAEPPCAVTAAALPAGNRRSG
jgi:hypothetical protein